MQAFVLILAALFSGGASNFQSMQLTESESPVHEDESSEEEAVSVQARTRVYGNPPGVLSMITRHGDLSHSTGTASTARSGHRLPNNLMAPLRC